MTLQTGRFRPLCRTGSAGDSRVSTSSLRGLAARHRLLLPAGLLILITVAVYADSFPGAFILDDHAIVRDNPLVSAPDLRKIFASDYWGEVPSGLYRPLTILSYALNRLLLGPDALGFHVVNVSLHALNAALLFAVLTRIGFPAAVGWFASVGFAIHPVNTEAVNLVVGRAELLVACFVFLGLLAAARRRWYAAGGAYLAALLCKEHAVVFPALVVAIDAFFAPSGRIRSALRQRLGLYAVLAAITGAWLLLRAAVLASGQAVTPIDNPLIDTELTVRILTALKVQVLYLAKLALPLHLQAVYTEASVPLVLTVGAPWGVVALTAVGLAFTLLLHGWRRRLCHGLGAALYAISVSVTANILFVTAVLMAERFIYLPSAWFPLLFASFALGRPGTGPAVWRNKAAAVLCGAWVLFLGGLTVARNLDYRSGIHLWESATAEDPRNVRAWMALAEALWSENRFDQAERAFRSAVAADPSFPDSSALFGMFLLERDRPQEALQLALRGGGGPLATVVLADASLRLGNARAALAYLDTVRLVPAVSEQFWLTKARAHEALGEHAAAAAAFEMIRRGQSPTGGIPDSR